MMAALLGWALLSEPVDGRTWVALVLAAAGVALMAAGSFDAGTTAVVLPLVVTASFAGDLIARHRREVSMMPVSSPAADRHRGLPPPRRRLGEPERLAILRRALVGQGNGLAFLTDRRASDPTRAGGDHLAARRSCSGGSGSGSRTTSVRGVDSQAARSRRPQSSSSMERDERAGRRGRGSRRRPAALRRIRGTSQHPLCDRRFPWWLPPNRRRTERHGRQGDDARGAERTRRARDRRAGALRDPPRDRRAGPDARARARVPALRRPPPHRGRARAREDADHQDDRRALGGTFHRIQFTPDLVPSDLIGTRVCRPDAGTFDTEQGPVFSNFLLADEINRAPAKVQSALLEAMQERQVTIGRETIPAAEPVPRHGDAEPDRARGHLSAARGAGRPFHAQGRVGYPIPRTS